MSDVNGFAQVTATANLIGGTYNVVASALEQLMTISILVAGALLVMKNDGFTIGMLVAFQMFASRLSQPMLRLVGLWQQFQQANISVERLGDVMNAPPEPYSVGKVRQLRLDVRGHRVPAVERAPKPDWLSSVWNVATPMGSGGTPPVS